MLNKKKYYKKVLSNFPFFLKDKKNLKHIVMQSLDEFSEEHPEATLSDYEEAFGNAEIFAEQILEEYAPDVFQKSFLWKRKFLTSIVIVCLIFIVLAIIGVIFVVLREPHVYELPTKVLMH